MYALFTQNANLGQTEDFVVAGLLSGQSPTSFDPPRDGDPLPLLVVTILDGRVIRYVRTAPAPRRGITEMSPAWLLPDPTV